MYASHGRLQEAMEVFSKLAAPDSFMWDSIIWAHADHQQPAQAISLYQRMLESKLKPSNYTFVAVLKACAGAKDLAFGKRVHADVLKSAEEPDRLVCNSLVDMYAKCGSLEKAQEVFDTLSTKDVVTWNAMFGGFAQHGLGQEALMLYTDGMSQKSFTPDNVTFVCLLKACASIGALSEAKQLHREIQERGLEADVVVGSSLVDMYAKCGSLPDSRDVFDRMSSKNVVTWTSMISGYAQNGLGHEALSLYRCMQQEGVNPANQVTFVCLLKACASIGALAEGKQLHFQIQERGLESDVVVGSCLVDMYAKCGDIEEAKRVFDRLPTRNVVTWTAMITGYSQGGLVQEALMLYESMQSEGITPADPFTFVCLLKACASVGALHQGRQLHSQIEERGLEADMVIGNSLVDMYAKCGSLGSARRVLDRLPRPDVVTWTALLNGYAQQNESQMARQCFQEMLQHGVEPDHATFTCLLVACSHEGLVIEGQQYFTMMVEDYGITPNLYHYNCMVDLLGRGGQLADAEHMLQTMPFDGDEVGWTSLLTACKTHGDVDRGRRCFDRLIKLQPQNSAAYILLTDLYSSAGRWRDVDRIEHLRRSAGASKMPAKAWIEVDSKVHSFSVGEERADISSKLRSVNLLLNQEAKLTKPASEKEQEDALCGHAEKLALAYGLLNTPDGTTLRVTKNLRMCDDCHTGTKVMSRIEQREIIVRDAHRVHQFVNGFCSCGDRH